MSSEKESNPMTEPTPATVAGAIIRFDPASETISRWRAEFLPLRVKGEDDRAGAAVIHDARMQVKNARVAVEKKRKELKADALEYGRRVDAEAKRITDQLEPIEAHLQAQEDIVRLAEERRRQEAARLLAERTDARVQRLAACQAEYSLQAIRDLPDEQFDSFASAAETRWREKQAAQAAQEAAAREERERLARERAELEEQRRAQAEREEALRRREREAELERAREEARRQAFEEVRAAEDKAVAETPPAGPVIAPGLSFAQARAANQAALDVMQAQRSNPPRRTCPTCGQALPDPEF